ncbi:MAG: ferrous iron transport protein A [Rhodocyclaceae bacterium]|jgi:ferrous iron transport protein A|nr:ferrous iron transport protein A [Rhodocyclaceae bacterium]
MTTIDELKVGEQAKIVGFTEMGRGYRRKLLALGLTPGAEIAVARLAPLGDPVEIRVRGFALSLRKEEAAALNVEKLR